MTDTRIPTIQPNAPHPGFEESNTIIVNFEEKLETLTHSRDGWPRITITLTFCHLKVCIFEEKLSPINQPIIQLEMVRHETAAHCFRHKIIPSRNLGKKKRSNTHGSVSAGQEKWLFNVLFF